MVTAWRALVVALLALSGLACEDASEPQAAAGVEGAATSPAADKRKLVRHEWIAQHDNIAPERWLASRAAGVDLPANDPTVAGMRALLESAHERFGDPSRMIANRAVQLEAMLKEKGISESAPELVELLSGAAGDRRALEGFGAMCQKYFILREQGVAREQAIAQLATKARAVQ